MGCDGGLPDQAFEYVIKNGGLDTEASYPYVARVWYPPSLSLLSFPSLPLSLLTYISPTQDESCQYSSKTIGTTCKSYVDIESKSESQLQVASATIGPISVGIDASHLSFQVSPTSHVIIM